MTCCGWNKNEYIINRTEYWRTEHKLPLRLAKECAEEDWKNLVEKYGEI